MAISAYQKRHGPPTGLSEGATGAEVISTLRLRYALYANHNHLYISDDTNDELAEAIEMYDTTVRDKQVLQRDISFLIILIINVGQKHPHL